MSQLTAIKCNVCNFVTKTLFKVDMQGWATIGFIVRVRGSHSYAKTKQGVRDKILESLGVQLHVCPGCMLKFEGGELNLRMITTDKESA